MLSENAVRMHNGGFFNDGLFLGDTVADHCIRHPCHEDEFDQRRHQWYRTCRYSFCADAWRAVTRYRRSLSLSPKQPHVLTKSRIFAIDKADQTW